MTINWNKFFSFRHECHRCKTRFNDEKNTIVYRGKTYCHKCALEVRHNKTRRRGYRRN